MISSPVLLSAREVDALLSNLGAVASRQQIQIGLQGAGLNDPRITVQVKWGTHEDVVAQGQVLDPRVLQQE